MREDLEMACDAATLSRFALGEARA